MNIYEIAKLANVSTATVSRVINNSGYVSKSTKKRILAVIEQTNFKPNKIAQNLSTNTSFKLIGLVCYNIEDLYYAKAVAVLEKKLRTFGYDIILCCTGENSKEKENTVNLLINKNVDAIIFIGSVFVDSSDTIKKISKILPVFIINAKIESENIFCAYCDDRSAVKYCALSLLNSGKKNILFLYDADTYSTSMKLLGYADALKSLNIDYNENYVIKCLPSIDNSKQTVLNFFENNFADAILCANDMLAVGALNAAKELGLNVPSQVAIIGYNNSVIAQCSCPKLTSLDNNVGKLAEITAENIYKHFENNADYTDYEVPFVLVKRETF